MGQNKDLITLPERCGCYLWAGTKQAETPLGCIFELKPDVIHDVCFNSVSVQHLTTNETIKRLSIILIRPLKTAGGQFQRRQKLRC